MEISFDYFGPINDDNISILKNFIGSQKQPISKLKININSQGGSILSGITMYNFLKDMPFEIVTHNMGNVSSAAILLYLVGNKRTAENASKFMIHPITMNTTTDMSFYKVQELLDDIDMDITNYSFIVNNNTNNLKNVYCIEKYLRSESLVLDKQKAYECGIITNM